MTIDEAIAAAREWTRGTTLHEDSDSPRVWCILMDEEIERLRAKLEWMPGGPDGIDCRNETIKLQDENAERLRARVADLERQIDAATDVICDLGGDLREPDMIESQRVRDDLRARVAMLEDDANEGRAITAMPIQIGDDLCYLPVNAHGIVTQALRHSEAMYAANGAAKVPNK